MRKLLFTGSLGIAAVVLMVGCSKQKDLEPSIPNDVKAKVQALGFGTSSLQTHEDGYMVEGDIVLTEEMLNSTPASLLLRVGNEEQYRTTNLVNAGTGRVIKVSISNRLPASYVPALDEALGRYNAEGLRITFVRVSSGADINVVQGNGNYLASAGFPTSTGNPYGQVKVNSRAIGTQPQSTVATILAHELGHCVGFRHTDYMDRSYSCGGSPTNEGASTVGAIHIPGTPTGPDANSWMLSCIGSGQNRPFNANDKTALAYLYK
ncbi:MAG TPA: M57 family metalloprotease [Chitinophagaceae bacterium]